MFLQVSVYLSFCLGGRVPCDHYPWCLWPHWWGPPNIRPEPPPSPAPRHLIRDCPGHQSWGPLANDIWWPTLEACSSLFTWVPSPPTLLQSNIWWWPLKHIWFTSGRYASYWNAFLLFNEFNDGTVIPEYGIWMVIGDNGQPYFGHHMPTAQTRFACAWYHENRTAWHHGKSHDLVLCWGFSKNRPMKWR